MSRRRYISTEMGFDTKLRDLAKECGEFGVLLYTWLIPQAEDDGTVRGTAETILARVFPLWRWIEVEDVATALSTMNRLELLEWDGNQVTFAAEKFYKYQSYIKPDKRRKTPQNADEQRKTPTITASPTHTPSPTPSLSPTPTGDAGRVVGQLCMEAGALGQIDHSDMKDFIDFGMTPELIRRGIQMMRDEKKKPAYMFGILRNWRRDGIRSVEQLKGKTNEVKPSLPPLHYKSPQEVLAESGLTPEEMGITFDE